MASEISEQANTAFIADTVEPQQPNGSRIPTPHQQTQSKRAHRLTTAGKAGATSKVGSRGRPSKTPGDFPDSVLEEQQELQPRPWVAAAAAENLGSQPSFGPQHPHYYSKNQYEEDAILVQHFARHAEEPRYRDCEFINHLSQADYFTALGVTATSSDRAFRKGRTKVQLYTAEGPLFHWLTDLPYFDDWLNRFRGGPSAVSQQDSPSARQPSAVQPSAEQPSAELPSAEQPSAEQMSPIRPNNDGRRPAAGGLARTPVGEHRFSISSPESRPAHRANRGKIPSRRPVDHSNDSVSPRHRETSDERRERELSEQAQRYEDTLDKQRAQIDELTLLIQRVTENQQRRLPFAPPPIPTRAPINRIPGYTLDSAVRARRTQGPEDLRRVGRTTMAELPRSPPINDRPIRDLSHTGGLFNQQLENARKEVERLERQADAHFSADPFYQNRSHVVSPMQPPRIGRRAFQQDARRFDNSTDDRHNSLTSRNIGRRRLNPTDIMVWDPSERTAQFFIDRFTDVAATEGALAVLDVLPLCCKEDALDWYTHLPRDIKDEMSTSLAAWEEQLLMEFRTNASVAHSKAKKLKFRLNDTDMPLSTYLRKKRALLRDAGVMDNNSIIYEVWTDIDDVLASITPLKTGETWQEFQFRIRENESAAIRQSRKDIRLTRGDQNTTGRNNFRTFGRGNTTTGGERSNRVEKTSPKKGSPTKRQPLTDVTNTAGRNGRKWIPQEEWDKKKEQWKKDKDRSVNAHLIADDRETTIGGDQDIDMSDSDEAFLNDIDYTSEWSSSPGNA